MKTRIPSAIYSTRAEARAAGETKFFPGKPCAAGHVDFWWVGGACVTCGNERKRAWAAANPERAKSAQAAHYVANKSAYKERASNWRKANPERRREIVRASPRNLEKTRTAERRRRAADPEKYRAKARNRKAQVRGAEGSFSAADLARILASQGGRCAYCRCVLTSKNRHLDHIQPVARRGSNKPRNLQYLCATCNRQKSAKDPLTYSRERGLLL